MSIVSYIFKSSLSMVNYKLADLVTGDIEEMEAHKEEIQREGRNKLAFLNAKLGKGGHPWETRRDPPP